MKIRDHCISNDGIGLGELELDNPVQIGSEDSIIQSIKSDAENYIQDALVCMYDWLFEQGKKTDAYAIARKIEPEFVATLANSFRLVPDNSKIIKATLKVFHDNGLDLDKDVETPMAGQFSSLVKRFGSIGLFNITKSFNWSKGFYGDNTCYFASHKEAKDYMEREPDYFALQLRELDGSGRARCWMRVIPGGAVLFNVYSKTVGEVSLDSMATLLRTQLATKDVSIQRIELRDGGTTGGMLYINSGSGMLIGLSSMIRGRTIYEMGTRLDTHFQCVECKNMFNRDIRRTVNGRSYCPGCYSKLWTVCTKCQATIPSAEAEIINGQVVCSDCLRSRKTCTICGSLVFRDEYTTHDSEVVCHKCNTDMNKRCINCGQSSPLYKYMVIQEPMSFMNGYYCPSCSKKIQVVVGEAGLEWNYRKD